MNDVKKTDVDEVILVQEDNKDLQGYASAREQLSPRVITTPTPEPDKMAAWGDLFVRNDVKLPSSAKTRPEKSPPQK